jgi:hypothetical protein
VEGHDGNIVDSHTLSTPDIAISKPYKQ